MWYVVVVVGGMLLVLLLLVYCCWYVVVVVVVVVGLLLLVCCCWFVVVVVDDVVVVVGMLLPNCMNTLTYTVIAPRSTKTQCKTWLCRTLAGKRFQFLSQKHASKVTRKISLGMQRLEDIVGQD